MYLSKLYFIYMTCISMLFCFSLLVRNVITHSLHVVCVWMQWWSRTFCSWEQMIRWIAMENLMLEYAGTQCFGRMWHCDMSFYIICITFWTCYFNFVINVNVNVLPTWAPLYLSNKIILINSIFSCIILYKYVCRGWRCHIHNFKIISYLTFKNPCFPYFWKYIR